MKEQFLQVVANTATPILATNVAREYLQARILLAIQDAGPMIPLAFQGGTALRFLYDIPRFSEDLDFALERPDRAPLDLEVALLRFGTMLLGSGAGGRPPFGVRCRGFGGSLIGDPQKPSLEVDTEPVCT